MDSKLEDGETAGSFDGSQTQPDLVDEAVVIRKRASFNLMVGKMLNATRQKNILKSSLGMMLMDFVTLAGNR